MHKLGLGDVLASVRLQVTTVSSYCYPLVFKQYTLAEGFSGLKLIHLYFSRSTFNFTAKGLYGPKAVLWESLDPKR